MSWLPNSARCFVCGDSNPRGLRMRFQREGELVVARFTPEADHQGYDDRVHGGVLSAVLDEMMVWACYVRTGRNAIKHLFFVASSLDSLVVGETQIRGQVRDAYQAAVDAGAIGPELHGLFRAALRVAKEISERTGVGRGNVSVAGAAADLAERVFGVDVAAAHRVVAFAQGLEHVRERLQRPHDVAPQRDEADEEAEREKPENRPTQRRRCAR